MANFDTRRRKTTLSNMTVGTSSSYITTDALTGLEYNTETNLLELTVPATATYGVVRISCSGQENARYRLYIGETLIETRRSGPSRTTDFVYPLPLILAARAEIIVKVTHYFEDETLDFEATLYGYKAATIVAQDYLLNEDGGFLLTEDGDRIIL